MWLWFRGPGLERPKLCAMAAQSMILLTGIGLGLLASELDRVEEVKRIAPCHCPELPAVPTHPPLPSAVALPTPEAVLGTS